MPQSKSAAVAERVRTMIADGTLRAGDRLPSTRAMAAELGIARGTVVAAYEQLDGEGWIRTRHGAPTTVAARIGETTPPHGPAPARTTPQDRQNTRRSTRASSIPRRDLRHDEQPHQHEHQHAPLELRPGIPAVTAIPDRDWRAAWRAAANAPLRNALSDPNGITTLREAVVAQLALSRGFAPTPDRVVVTSGTSDAVSLITEALRTHLGRSPVIAVEDPGYRSGRRAVLGAGGTLVGIPVDDDGLDPGRLPERIDAVMVTPTHQYPLGSVMPVDRRRRLLERAASLGAVVVEDDYDSEFRHRGDPLPALAALDAEGVVLHVGSFSKVLDPRLRCGYVVVPDRGSGADPAVSAAVLEARLARGPAVAEPVQEAIAHLLRTGALRRHLGRVRRDYAHKRDLIARRLAPVTARNGLEARALDGGLHTVLTWPAPATGASVVTRMLERGFRVADLADYAVTPATARNGIVLGYGAVSAVELDAALDVLVPLVRTASGRPD